MTYGNLPDWYRKGRPVSENGYATEVITEEAIRYIEERSKDKETPFFLYLAYNAPHFGKGYSPADRKPINIMQAQAKDLKRVAFFEDKIRREFAAMTVSLDEGIGQVLDCLDQNNLTDDTLLIFLTDHGGDPTYGGSNLPYRGNKAELFEGGIRVPCLVRWPGKIEPGRQVEESCWALDWFPTFLDLAGLRIERPFVDGRSLAPVLSEGAHPPRGREFYWETGGHSVLGRKQWRALRSGNLKYVLSPEEGEFSF